MLSGTSVNFGKKNGLAVLIQSNLSAFALFCHCAWHRAALCISKATKNSKFAKEHLKSLRMIARRYAYSGKRREELSEVCTLLEVPDLKPDTIFNGECRILELL